MNSRATRDKMVVLGFWKPSPIRTDGCNLFWRRLQGYEIFTFKQLKDSFVEQTFFMGERLTFQREKIPFNIRNICLRIQFSNSGMDCLLSGEFLCTRYLSMQGCWRRIIHILRRSLDKMTLKPFTLNPCMVWLSIAFPSPFARRPPSNPLLLFMILL